MSAYKEWLSHFLAISGLELNNKGFHCQHPNHLRTNKDKNSLKVLEKLRTATNELQFYGSYKKRVVLAAARIYLRAKIFDCYISENSIIYPIRN